MRACRAFPFSGPVVFNLRRDRSPHVAPRSVYGRIIGRELRRSALVKGRCIKVALQAERQALHPSVSVFVRFFSPPFLKSHYRNCYLHWLSVRALFSFFSKTSWREKNVVAESAVPIRRKLLGIDPLEGEKKRGGRKRRGISLPSHAGRHVRPSDASELTGKKKNGRPKLSENTDLYWQPAERTKVSGAPYKPNT